MKHLTIFFTMVTCLFFTFHSIAQDEPQMSEEHEMSEEHQIKFLIDTLFDGMREGDSAKVASVFHTEINMFTSYTNQEGDNMIKKGSRDLFLKAIGTPHEEIWDEKIWNTKIEIDGGIAQVWTDYAFYVGSEFSHCGVDAFHLIKDNEKGWKIIHLMDTRRKNGCEMQD